jgi:hypothetical protein
MDDAPRSDSPRYRVEYGVRVGDAGATYCCLLVVAMSKRSKGKSVEKRPPPRGDLGSKAKQFADALADNEEAMAEMAAFAVTCEQFGIDEEEGYDLLAEAAQ